MITRLIVALGLVYQIPAPGSSPSADDLVRGIGAAARATDVARASRLFQELVSKYPDNPAIPLARLELANSQFQRGMTDAAAQTLCVAADSHGDAIVRERTAYLLALVRYQKARGTRSEADLAAAADAFGTFLVNHPAAEQVPLAIFYRLEAFRLVRRNDDVIKAADEFHRRFPGHEKDRTVQLARANALAARNGGGDAVEAEKHFRLLISNEHRWPESRKAALALAQLIAPAPSDASPTATARLEESIALLNGLVDPPSGVEVEARLVLADLLATRRKEYARAASLLEDVPRMFPRSTRRDAAQEKAGEYRFRQPDDRQVEADLRELATSDSHPAAAYFMGKSWIRTGQAAKAAELLERTAKRQAQDTRWGPELELAAIDATAALPERRALCASRYARFARDHEKHPDVARCLYHAAEIAYGARDLKLAGGYAREFLKTDSARARDDLAPAALLIAAEGAEAGGPQEIAEAVSLLERLIRDYRLDPVTPRARVLHGRLLFRLGRYQAAIDALKLDVREIVDRRVKADVYFWIGRACAALGRHPEARDAQITAIGLGGDHWPLAGRAYFELALADVRTFPVPPQEAVMAFEKVVALAPKDPLAAAALDRLGTIHLQQQQLDKAGATFDRLLREYHGTPEAFRAAYGRASILMQRGKLENALETLEQLGRVPRVDEIVPGWHVLRAMILYVQHNWSAAEGEAKSYLDSGCASGPEKERAQLVLWLARLKQGHDRPTALDRIEKLLGGQVVLSPKQRMEVLDELVGGHLDLAGQARSDSDRRVHEAKASELSRALVALPTGDQMTAEDWLKIGLARERTALYEAAQEAYTAGMVVAKSGSEIETALRVRRAAVRLALGNYRDALDDLGPILERPAAQRPLEATHLAGRVEAVSGRLLPALGHFQVVVDDPRSAGSVRLAVQLDAARVEVQIGRRDQARQRLEHLLALAKDTLDRELEFQARLELADVVRTGGDPTESLRLYRSIAEDPAASPAVRARARFHSGVCAFWRATLLRDEAKQPQADLEFAEALKEFRAVLAISREQARLESWAADALYESARCLERLERPTEAIKPLEEFTKRFPGHKKAPLVNDLLKRCRSAGPDKPA
jgi:tetratricopeptide (TPR) repeat protein